MKPISTRKFLFISILSSLFSLTTIAQTTRTVCPGGCDFTTIQAAATAANSGDIILINVAGTFTEKNITLPEKNLTIKGLGKSVTFLQSAATRASASGGRIFRYNVPAVGNNTFAFEDMTIQNAYAPLTDLGGGQWQSAGGVFYASGTLRGLRLTMNNVRFYANETTGGNNINSGGACFYLSASGSGYTYNAEITVDNCEFEDNRVANSAGSSLSDGPCFDLLGSPAKLTINNSKFINNNGYTRGGVIYVGASWTTSIKNSLFEGNTARNGDGGCFSARSGLSWEFDNCLFKNNSAVYVSPVNGNNGFGGVYMGRGAKFRNCTFYNNSAVKGGAICRTNNTLNEEMQLINCTFYGNSASVSGRAIQNGTSGTGNYPFVMVNTIISNGGGAASSDFHFMLPYSMLTVNSRNYCNSISTENATPGTTPVFDFNSGNSNLNISATLADNGGTTQTLALASNSSMRDAGICATGATYEIPVKDQRNYSRTDGSIDIGAMEYNGIPDNPAAPSISYTAPGSTISTGDRIITATIADVNGVHWYPQFTDNRPRIYFRKNSDTWKNNVGSWVDGSGVNGTWDFTISAAAMGGLANGDVVYYYIIAQDVSTVPAIHSVPSGVIANSVNNIVTPPVPNFYVIGSTLPVKLESFNASAHETGSKLTWKSSMEENFSHYEIQRSTDGRQWTAIANVAGTGQRTYNYADNNLDNGTYFYRLRCVDNNDTYTMSEVRQVRIEGQSNARVYPNPVTQGKLNIQVQQPATARIYNNAGVQVMQKRLQAGVQEIQVSGLAAGAYQVVVDGKSFQVLIQK